MTLLLLSLSPVGADCEIRCELARSLCGCHGGAAEEKTDRQAQPQAQVGDMPGMEHAAPADDGPRNLHVAAAVPARKARACVKQVVLLDEAKSADRVSLGAPAAVSGEPANMLEPPSGSLSSRGPPGLPRATPVSLRTTLRV